VASSDRVIGHVLWYITVYVTGILRVKISHINL